MIEKIDHKKKEVTTTCSLRTLKRSLKRQLSRKKRKISQNLSSLNLTLVVSKQNYLSKTMPTMMPIKTFLNYKRNWRKKFKFIKLNLPQGNIRMEILTKMMMMSFNK